jgi:heme oxygenase (biliverdin-IX-beta and delta-forming)
MRMESFQEWPGLAPPLDVWRRRRAYLLVADMRALGAQITYSHAVVLPEIDRFAQAFGALYVIEGSRLGGRILARQVSAAVGDAADGALCFLRSNDASDVGLLWKEFCESLGGFAAGSTPATCDAIVAAALDTFRCFDRQLQRWEV